MPRTSVLQRKFNMNKLCFIDRFRFTLIKEHLVEFNQLAMANAEGLDHMLNRVMPKDNIGLAALLQTTEGAWENGKYVLRTLQKRNLINFHCSTSRFELDKPTSSSMHGSYSLGSGILRRKTNSNHDA